MGPPRRRITYGWSQVDLYALRTLSGAKSYVGISGGFALGSGEDPAGVIPGIVETQLRSGEVPVILLPRIPTSTSTITDPTLFLYGRLATDSIGRSVSQGTEGVDEVLSLSGFTIEEVR
jgi:hypothetical protein